MTINLRKKNFILGSALAAFAVMEATGYISNVVIENKRRAEYVAEAADPKTSEERRQQIQEGINSISMKTLIPFYSLVGNGYYHLEE